MSNKSLLSWESSSLDWKTWNTCQNLDLKLIIDFLVRFLALSLNFAIWILCWAFACDRVVCTRLYASESIVGRAGLSTDCSSPTLFFISNPQFVCAIFYMLTYHISLITMTNVKSSGHIDKSNQSTSSRLGEESHFLLLFRIEIFEFD